MRQMRKMRHFFTISPDCHAAAQENGFIVLLGRSYDGLAIGETRGEPGRELIFLTLGRSDAKDDSSNSNRVTWRELCDEAFEAASNVADFSGGL
jgi:hypothetical protein